MISGARIITKFSEQINAIRYYDKFHFHKILFDNTFFNFYDFWIIKKYKDFENKLHSYENANYYGGNAETFIGHYLKKYTKTAFSRHNIDYLKGSVEKCGVNSK